MLYGFVKNCENGREITKALKGTNLDFKGGGKIFEFLVNVYKRLFDKVNAFLRKR